MVKIETANFHPLLGNGGSNVTCLTNCQVAYAANAADEKYYKKNRRNSFHFPLCTGSVLASAAAWRANLVVVAG